MLRDEKFPSKDLFEFWCEDLASEFKIKRETTNRLRIRDDETDEVFMTLVRHDNIGSSYFIEVLDENEDVDCVITIDRYIGITTELPNGNFDPDFNENASRAFSLLIESLKCFIEWKIDGGEPTYAVKM